MWGDYQVDDPNTLTQAQKNKLINQAKLIAGITAVFAGEDVNVAAGVAAEAVRWNSSYPNYGSMSKNQQAECRQLGISTSDCGKYHGKKNLETLRQIGLFIIPTTPEEIAIAVVTGGAGRYAIKAGGKILSKTFESKEAAKKVLAEARRVRYNNPQTHREYLARQAGIPRDIINNPASIWGKTIDQIKQSLEMDGAIVTKKPARRGTSGNGNVYEVKGGSSGIKEFEYHSGGGSHTAQGVPYYKIVKNDGTEIRVIDTNQLFHPHTISPNQVYLNKQGNKLEFIGQGKWRIKK